ncbi:MAG TPA: NAD(P)-dependent oxidoreductase [Candidatus Eremiobacteraceae bacterium]|nr:NAD(P)-dependent oxidoreductase [Candidatus Eremiobacteraceae bacterium]
MATIAFCGIGLMGAPMAGRLRKAGHMVRVWNRTPAKAAKWAEEGGVACKTPADAADPASEIHLMLANDDAVDHALFDNDGALKTLPQGSLVVDHSTVSMIATGPRAQRVKSGGWRYLHAPVLAGPTNVADGEGLMIVAGDRGVYDASKSRLEEIIVRQWYVGEAEQDAASLKLMANSMLVNITQALAEFFALGRACGIAPERALELFDHFDPGRTIKIRGPRMAHGDYTPAFQASMAAKDVDLMVQAARQGGADVPGLELVLHRLLRLIKSGRGDLDLSALGLVAVAPAAGQNGSASGDG